MAGFFKALFISAAILCFFAMFFLTFLIAPMLVLIIFYFAIDASDRRRKEAKRRAEQASEAPPERPALEYNESEPALPAGPRAVGIAEPRRAEPRFSPAPPAEGDAGATRMPPLALTPNRVANGSNDVVDDEPAYAAVAGDEGGTSEHAFVGGHQDVASAEAAADRVAAERSAAAAAQRAAALAGQDPVTGDRSAPATASGAPGDGSAADPGMAEFFGDRDPAVAPPSDPPAPSTRTPGNPDDPPPPTTRPDGSQA